MNHMLHHLSLPVASLEKSSNLYDAALSALGYRRVCSGDNFMGYGIHDNEDKFAIKAVSPNCSAGPGFHIAFNAPGREAADRFHETPPKFGTQHAEAIYEHQ